MYKLAQRFGKKRLIEQTQALDPGFDLDVLGEMPRTIDRFDDHDIPLAPEELPVVGGTADQYPAPRRDRA